MPHSHSMPSRHVCALTIRQFSTLNLYAVCAFLLYPPYFCTSAPLSAVAILLGRHPGGATLQFRPGEMLRKIASTELLLYMFHADEQLHFPAWLIGAFSPSGMLHLE